MPRNLQFRRTDKNILDAFRKIMNTKTFEAIIIQDILDEAMINRSTFYAHFADKYAVAERLQDLVLSNLIKSFKAFQDDTLKKTMSMSDIGVYYQTLSGNDFKLLQKIKTDRVNILAKIEQIIESNYISTHKNSPYCFYESKLLSAILIRFMTFGPVNEDTNNKYLTSLTKIYCEFIGIQDPQLINRLYAHFS